MKKLGLLTLIVISSVFLMSHNANAVTNTVYLQYGIYAYGWPAGTGSESGAPVYVTANENYNNQNNIYAFSGVKDYSYMAFWYNASHTPVDYSEYTDYSFSFTYCGEDIFFSPVSNTNYPRTYYYETTVDSSKYLNDFRDSTNPDVYISTNYKCNNVFLMGKFNNRNNAYFVLGNTQAGQFTRLFSFSPYSNASEFKNLVIISPILTLYTNEDEAANALKEEKQSVQDAVDDSQTSGDNSQNSAESATQSLLTTINNGIGVITSARATNCQIDGNMGNLDLGNLDLCANPVPTFVQIILSLVAVVTVIPLAIVLFNRFIGIFRSFQG